MNAAIVARLLESRQITDQGGIDGLQSGLGTAIEDAVNKHEKSYQFLDGEALFISDLTFAVVSGMVDGGFELTDMQLMQSANDICISTIESIAN